MDQEHETVPPSIHDLRPIEDGGADSREGLSYQDHVVVGYCMQMLKDTDPQLGEVWCDFHDDATLIWYQKGITTVEFVQAKDRYLNQLWSISLLTTPDKKGGKSLVEKSLAHDGCKEPTRFRFVTSSDLARNLLILLQPIGGSARLAAKGEVDDIADEIAKRLPGLESPTGHDIKYWVHNLVWEVRHLSDDVENANLIEITQLSSDSGRVILIDQAKEVYSKLLMKVHNASGPGRKGDTENAKIRRDDFRKWFDETVDQVLYPLTKGGGEKLKEKMEAAKLPPDTVKVALEQRRGYRQEILVPRYMPVNNRELANHETMAVLQRLKADLDAGKLMDDGTQFHALCLERLEVLSGDLKGHGVSLSFLQGCMYDITDRCLHRFRRTSA